MGNMDIDKKILEEIKRYKSINNYIMEQVPPPPGGDLPLPGGDVPPPPGGEVPPAPGGDVPPPPGGAPPAPGTEPGAPVDVETDADVEEIGTEEGGEEEGGEEELDITDLVDTQKTMSDKQEEYFNNLFTQLSTLETKLGEMDQLVQKINSLETKFDQFRPKTPEEKLELRSLDSGPFKQKLSDFFVDKQEEMRQSGKNEYVLTSDEIEDYSPEEVKTSFNDYDENEDNNMM
jgi:hypothetical protein